MVARRLAGDYAIVAAARAVDELESLRAGIESDGGECRVVPVDVADPAAVAAAFGGIEADVLVNNAGVGHLKPLLELTPEEWHRMVDVNFNALFHVTRALLPGMVRRRSGHVVFIGSIGGRSAFVGGTCYGATKHAVMGLSESLMLEVRDKGVKVSVVNPGSVASHFSERADPSWMISPEDVAESVSQVVSTPPGVLIHRLEIRALMPKKH